MFCITPGTVPGSAVVEFIQPACSGVTLWAVLAFCPGAPPVLGTGGPPTDVYGLSTGVCIFDVYGLYAATPGSTLWSGPHNYTSPSAGGPPAGAPGPPTFTAVTPTPGGAVVGLSPPSTTRPRVASGPASPWFVVLAVRAGGGATIVAGAQASPVALGLPAGSWTLYAFYSTSAASSPAAKVGIGCVCAFVLAGVYNRQAGQGAHGLASYPAVPLPIAMPASQGSQPSGSGLALDGAGLVPQALLVPQAWLGHAVFLLRHTTQHQAVAG